MKQEIEKTQFKRVLLKLSGEAFKGERNYGIDPQFLGYIADEIKSAYTLNVQLALVVGGGNIFRGMAAAANGMDRVTADFTGMLATIMNALALQDALAKIEVPSRVQTAIEMKEVAEPFILRRALRHLDKGRIVIFAGGTGNPYFTTDTTAALRAAEIDSDALIKATKVDGVYTEDPEKNENAELLKEISYKEVIKKQLKVMDGTAFTLSMDNKIPIIVFNLNNKGYLKRILLGEKLGTQIGVEKA